VIDAEPRLRDELERWQPLPDMAGRWEDVLVRAGIQRAPRSLRWLSPRIVAIAVAALVLLAGGTAYAIAREFFIGDPAPPAVKEQAALLNEVKGELIPRVHQGPRLRVDETRLAARVDASTGSVYLWVTPTTSGGYCLFTHIVGTELADGRPNLGAHCGEAKLLDASLNMTRVQDGRMLALVYGRVAEPVRRVVMRRSGRTMPIRLSGQFFLDELPNVPADDVPRVTVTFIGYDASGDEVVRRELGAPPALGTDHRLRQVDVSSQTPLLEIRTRRTGKPVRLYVIEREGKRCTVLVSPGGTGTSCGGRGPTAREIAVAPNQIGAAPDGMLLLWGEAGSAITELVLRFEDGRVEDLPLRRHFTLYQVDPRDFAAGRRPVAVVGKGASGEVIAERELGPWRR
jgi:hypothetical protein